MGWKKVGEAKRTPEDQERLQRAQQEQREFEAQQRARQQESRELDWQAQQRQTAEAPAYDNLRDRAMSMSQSSGERPNFEINQLEERERSLTERLQNLRKLPEQSGLKRFFTREKSNADKIGELERELGDTMEKLSAARRGA